MKFEIINEKNKAVMNTMYPEYIPGKEQINNLLKDGYKIKVDGKMLNKKKIDELMIEKKKGDI